MVSFVRNGPKMLIMASDQMENLGKYLEAKFEAINSSLNEAFENSTEEHTIVLIVTKAAEVIHSTDIEVVILINGEPDVILCNTFNDQKNNLITATRIAPRVLIMRALGSVEKMITAICRDYDALQGNLFDMLENNNGEGTILTFTKRPLTKKVGVNDFYETSLFIKERYVPLKRDFNFHGLKYVNAGLDNKDWHELEIKIYDKYEAYELHYRRLSRVLDFLQLGFILGESWGKDTAHILLVVGVYRVKYFTYFEPTFIKKILLGLEYLDDGTRIIDYDVFDKRRKISWTAVKEDTIKDKTLLSKKYRNFIFDQLDENQKTEIWKLEKDILKTRI